MINKEGRKGRSSEKEKGKGKNNLDSVWIASPFVSFPQCKFKPRRLPAIGDTPFFFIAW
jgi:hypothetical protein